MICPNQDMQIAGGLPVYVEGFTDGEPKLCYPYVIKDFLELNSCLSIIDTKDLYVNFQSKEKTEAVALLLSRSFRIEDDNELQTFLHTINSDNFEELINDIKMISGIEEQDELEVDERVKKFLDTDSNKTDWDVAMSAVVTYTSETYSSIHNMTVRQFNKLYTMVGKRITWEYKTNTMSLTEKPSEYIDENEHPLYSEPKTDKPKVTTMKDIMGMVE